MLRAAVVRDFTADYMERADLMDPLSYRGLRLWSHRDQSSCARR